VGDCCNFCIFQKLIILRFISIQLFCFIWELLLINLFEIKKKLLYLTWYFTCSLCILFCWPRFSQFLNEHHDSLCLLSQSSHALIFSTEKMVLFMLLFMWSKWHVLTIYIHWRLDTREIDEKHIFYIHPRKQNNNYLCTENQFPLH
jgi:hypothetical protein